MLTSTEIRNRSIRRRNHMAEKRMKKNLRGWKTHPVQQLKVYDPRHLEIPRDFGRVVGTSFCMK